MSSMDIDTPPLELVEDDISEEEHRKFNKELQGLSSLITPENFAGLGKFLLSGIVRQLGDRASTDYAFGDFSKLIAEQPHLRNMLLRGLQEGYDSVRRLKILRKAPQNELSDMPESISHPPQTTGSAKLAWRCKYRGDYHSTMLETINATKRSGNYANSVTLIQSSGSGKSRMVDEMAKLVFTIPLNLRHPSEYYERAYPPSDYDVWNYLCVDMMESVSHGKYLANLFFRHLFSQVTSVVSNKFSKRELFPGELASQWREYLAWADGRNRNVLYNSVINACRKDAPSGLPATEDELLSSLYSLLAALGKICVFPKPDNVKIVLYFDEAHQLNQTNASIGIKTRYNIILSALYNFRNPCVFSLFLSTQPSLCLLAPSAGTVRSSRQQETNMSFAPITETPFDCHPDLPLRPGEYRLADLCKLEFLTRFGRPLFWTMLTNSKGHDCSMLLDDMMKLARKKLLFHDGIDRLDKHGQTAMCAILDVLITINYEPRGDTAHSREMEMVASHMRTAFSVPEHRLYLRSGYPSEPFLAEAASRQMHRYIEDLMGFSMIKVLKTDFDDGLINPDQKGEVVMRLLLRKAYMDAIVAEQGPACPNFSVGCSFLVFLEALFAEDFRDLILDCRPANRVASRIPLKDAFKNAVVRFTHFVKAADSSTITTRGMVMGFLRGSAIMGHDTQEAINIAIPVLLHKDRKIEEVSMSAFLIQVKRRSHSGTVNANLIDAKELGFFPEGSTEDTRSYVTLVAELGVEAAPSATSSVSISQSRARASARVASISMKEHPRYSVRTYECTNKTWSVVLADELAYYTQILSTDELLTDHPRQNEATLQAVRRMLPFWYRDVAWFSDEPLEPAFQPRTPVEVDSSDETSGPESVLEGSSEPEASMAAE